MASKEFNVGVIGYGMSAKVFHIPFISASPFFRLHSIVQRSPSSDNSAPSDHPTLKHYTEASSVFTDAAVDLVVITTTPESHYALAHAALSARKHVLVEKPFVPTLREAEALIALAREQNKLLCIYQNRRWDTDFLSVQHLIENGTLGRIIEFETHFDRYSPVPRGVSRHWKAQLGMHQAGGVLYDLGTHMIDQVYTLFGMPAGVTAVLRNERDSSASDSADGNAPMTPEALTLLLQYKEKTKPLVTIKASVMSVETEQVRFWVRGSKGSFKKHWLDVQEEQLIGGMEPGSENFAREETERWGSLTILQDGKPSVSRWEGVQPKTYAQLYEEFARALRENHEDLVPVKGNEALDVLRIIEAAKESAKEGKTVFI